MQSSYSTQVIQVLTTIRRGIATEWNSIVASIHSDVQKFHAGPCPHATQGVLRLYGKDISITLIGVEKIISVDNFYSIPALSVRVEGRTMPSGPSRDTNN